MPLYVSTRSNAPAISSAEAILKGIAPDGGLYVPGTIPEISPEELKSWLNLDYPTTSANILAKFLTDYTLGELSECTAKAYSDNFSHPDICPVVMLNRNTFFLELWHGPTAAFKDMALQILPYLTELALRKCNSDKKLYYLVATSGDTGKAALEGFKDKDFCKIIVFFPEDGVSKVQKLQMVTQEGKNVKVVGVKGNFDDCQNGVKKIFSDSDFNPETLGSYELTSANSINWGRLVPQIPYYFKAYLDLVKQSAIEFGEKINIVVPTGNFGNILAAWYAKQMGLPVSRLIIASNDNRILTDFIETGEYDIRREFHLTPSPSMDILISSNLERLLFEVSGHNWKMVGELMSQLRGDKHYMVSEEILQKIQYEFSAGYANGSECSDITFKCYDSSVYTIDPHTAVGASVLEKYKKKTNDPSKTIIASTASPYKFPAAVLDSLGINPGFYDSEMDMMADLETCSEKMPIPNFLASLDEKPVLHTTVCSLEEMPEIVKSF